MAGEWVDQVSYPQAPSMTDHELESLFEEAIFARLGTMNEDGTIHMAPVYFKYIDGQIIMASQEPSRKIRNIKRSSSVSILIDLTAVPFKGALIYGTAELDYEDVVDKRIAIFERTRSRQEAEEYARRLSGRWPCAIIRVTPAHFATFDYAKF